MMEELEFIFNYEPSIINKLVGWNSFKIPFWLYAQANSNVLLLSWFGENGANFNMRVECKDGGFLWVTNALQFVLIMSIYDHRFALLRHLDVSENIEVSDPDVENGAMFPCSPWKFANMIQSDQLREYLHLHGRRSFRYFIEKFSAIINPRRKC